MQKNLLKIFLISIAILLISISFINASEINNKTNPIEANDLTMYYKNGSSFTATFFDDAGNPLTNTNVKFNINNVTYTKKTNANGIANLKINLNSGNYKIISSYNKNNCTNNVNVLSTITSNDLTLYYKNGTSFSALFKDCTGNRLINTEVTFNINGVIYHKTTNNMGIANLKINLQPGKYIISTTNLFNNEITSNNITVLSKIIVKDTYFINRYYGTYVIKLVDNTGNPLSDKTITSNIEGKYYYTETNDEGIANLYLELGKGPHIITNYYEDSIASNNINVIYGNTYNPALYLTTEEQLKTIESLKSYNNRKLYSMDYTADHILNDVLKNNLTNVFDLVFFLSDNLLYNDTEIPTPLNIGCTAFCVKTPDNDTLYGRNYDWGVSTPVILKVNPTDGYKSINMVDALYLAYPQGSFEDGYSDLSRTMIFPYCLMDGMNEKGLAVSGLQLPGPGIHQDSGKPDLTTTVAMRLVLDKADSVDSAIELLKEYDMHSLIDLYNFHFLISDSSGRSVVVEHINNTLIIIEANHITNFYLEPSMNQTGKGQDRYKIVDDTLKAKNNTLTLNESFELLNNASQYYTAWSIVYDLTNLKCQFVLRKDYTKIYEFDFNSF